MKKLWILILLLLVMALPVMADDTGFYISGKYTQGKINLGDVDVVDNISPLINLTVDAGSSDKVSAGGVAVGMDYGFARLELEYFDRSTARYDAQWFNNGLLLGPATTLDVSTETIFANVYVDLPLAGWLEAYAGIGLGQAKHSTDMGFFAAVPGVEYSDSNKELAWNVQAGLAFLFTDSLTLDVGYRYADLGKADIGLSQILALSFDASNVEVEASEVMVALRYTF